MCQVIGVICCSFIFRLVRGMGVEKFDVVFWFLGEGKKVEELVIFFFLIDFWKQFKDFGMCSSRGGGYGKKKMKVRLRLNGIMSINYQEVKLFENEEGGVENG